MSLILDGTNGLSDVDGTAGTPAIRGSDANTGVFFGTDIVGVSTGGSERMRVDASGNVGIGTSSPVQKAHLDGGAGDTYLQFSNSTTGSTSSDGSRIGIASADTALRIQNLESAPIRFDIAGTERMRIDSGGNLLVGKTANDDTTVGLRYVSGQYLSIVRDGNPPIYLNRLSSNGRIAEFARSSTTVGSIEVTTTNTSYVTSSDYRLKHDIQPMTGALAKIAALKPVTYKWNADDSDGEGFIAHELAEVCPSAVSGEKDAVDANGNPQYQGIDTSFLVATLTAAIQEQQAIIESLTARVVALEGQA